MFIYAILRVSLRKYILSWKAGGSGEILLLLINLGSMIALLEMQK